MDYDKHNFTFDDETDTVRYKQSRYFYFEKEKSGGKADDVITMINVIFVVKNKHLYSGNQNLILLRTEYSKARLYVFTFRPCHIWHTSSLKWISFWKLLMKC